MHNPSDLYAVAVRNDAGTVVDHVPRMIISGLLTSSASAQLCAKSQVAGGRQWIYPCRTRTMVCL